MNYDIVIVGAGPAGSTLARLLSKKHRVLILDKKSKIGNTGFKKPCGGLLAPDAQQAMAKFGLGFPTHATCDPQIFSVETIDLNSNIIRHYQRFYLNFDRHKFDLWLMSLIPENVVIDYESKCKSIIKTNSGFKVDYLKDNIIHSVTCKYIVGADGAKSIVRNSCCPKPIHQYTSIQQWFKSDGYILPHYVCFFDHNITHSYGWINIKDGYIQFGAALPKENSRQAFDKLKDHFTSRGYNFSNPVFTEACLVNCPRKITELHTGKDNAFLIGEAAGFISPSSLEGISYAMNSAHILADVLNSFPNNPNLKYKRKCTKIKLKIMSKLIKWPFLYVPPIRYLVMKSGISSIKIIDDIK